MSKKIELYKASQVDLGSLIGDLEGLLDMLQTVGNSWKNSFSESWWELEIRYALSLSENDGKLTREDLDSINDSLNELQILIKEQLCAL